MRSPLSSFNLIVDSILGETGLSRGGIAGIVVGATVSAVIIVSLILFIFMNSGTCQWPFSRSSRYEI